jgi:hypothetical protein
MASDQWEGERARLYPGIHVSVVLADVELCEKQDIRITVWTGDFEAPVCDFYLLFISADAAIEK